MAACVDEHGNDVALERAVAQQTAEQREQSEKNMRELFERAAKLRMSR